jgi:DNA modification methylase
MLKINKPAQLEASCEPHDIKPFWESGDRRAVVYLGDCISVMASLPAETFDTILMDPPYGLEFMGSGTTGVACLQVGRRFVGIEQDPESCEVAVKRLQKVCAYRFHGTKHHRWLNAKINKKLKGESRCRS